MAKNHLYCDDNEIITKALGLSGVRTQNMGFSTLNPGETRGVRQYEVLQKWEDFHIPAGEIRRIVLTTTRRRVFGLVSVGGDCIVIERHEGDSVMIPRHRERRFFDDYVARLRDFAARNGVRFEE